MPREQTAAAPPSNASRDRIQITEWKPRSNKTLRGFFTAVMPSGMIIRDLMLHEKGEARWIGTPSREYKTSDGERKFAPIIEFTDTEVANRFRDAILAALDDYFAEARP